MDDFLNFAEGHELKIKKLVADGKIHRVGTEQHPWKKNGSYFFDGKFGWVQNFETMAAPAVFRDGNKKPSDGSQGRAMAKKMARAMEDQARAIKRAEAIFKSFEGVRESHPYFLKKGVTMRGVFGVRVSRDGKLIIPIYRGGEFISFQSIDDDGKKRFALGCPVAGGCFVIRRKSARVLLFCEGFATGLTLFQSCRDASVVVAFNAGNLLKVAERFRDTAKNCLVCADNDHETEGRTGKNMGVECGRRAAQVLGCGVVFPEGINGTDYNDAKAEGWSDFRIRNEIIRGLSRGKHIKA